MGFLFARAPASTLLEVYTGIQVSTSKYGGAIPLVYGRQRVSFNLIWYGDFQAIGQGGGGKGGGGAPSSYNYITAYIAALCEGPIVGVNQVWHDKALETLYSENLSLALGTSGQPIWSYLTTYAPPGATFAAYISGDVMTVTTLSSGTLADGQTITGTGVASGTKIVDSGAAGGGVGGYTITPAQTVGSSGAPIPMQASTGAAGAQAVPYDHIAYVASDSYNLGSSAAMPNLNFEVDGLLGYDIAAGMYDADPSQLIPDYLTDPNHGAGFEGAIATLTGLSNSYQAYCMCVGLLNSPYEDTQREANAFLKDQMQITNSDIVLSAGQLKIIPYAAASVPSVTTADGKTWSWAPDLTPLYSLDDDDFCPKAGDPPVKLTRKAQSECYNIVLVEYVDRSNYYNTAIAEAYDLEDIEANGQRLMPTCTLHQITNAATARTVAQLILNANLFERNTAEFRARQDFALVEPMDILSITDSSLGWNQQLVRVLEVQDDEEDFLTFKVLMLDTTVRITPQYNWSAAQGYMADYSVPPGSVLAPRIFLVPPAMSGGALALGIAVAGPSGAPYWLGCYVYMSLDGGNTYVKVGVVTTGAAYGTLTNAVSAGSSQPDTSTILDVTLADTNLELDNSVTSSDAFNALSLILVDSGSDVEIMSFGVCSGSGGSYTLSDLYRGLYGSTNQGHAANVPFVRLDQTIFQITLDPYMAGQTVYFKFCSYNTYTQGTQQPSDADVIAYSYTIPSAVMTATQAKLTPRGSVIVSGGKVYKTAAGSTGWDGDAVTTQAFPALSIEVQYGSGTLAVGLVGSIASTLQPLSNMDYAFSNASGQWAVVSGSTTLQGGLGVPARGDVLSVAYDSYTVMFLLNGTVVWQTQERGAQLYAGIAFDTPGAIVNDVIVTGNTGATPTPFRGINYGVVGNAVASKIGGTTTWDSGAIALQGFTTCHISAKTNAVTNNNFMFGLATQAHVSTMAAQAAGSSSIYASIDYAWECATDADEWAIWESGTKVATFAAPSTSDKPFITYDGSNVRYYLNTDSAPVRTVARSGATLYGAIAFYDSGAGLNSLDYGATVSLAVIDTAQLGDSAATDIVTSSFSVTCPATGGGVTLGTVSVGTFADDVNVVVTTTGQWENNSTTTACIFAYEIEDQSSTTSTDVDIYCDINTGTAGTGVFALEWTFTLPAGTSGVYTLYGEKLPTAAAASVTATGTLKAEVIKR